MVSIKRHINGVILWIMDHRDGSPFLLKLILKYAKYLQAIE